MSGASGSRPTKYGGLLSPYLRDRRHAAARPWITGRVLDVGCAEGHLAGLVPAGRYVGIDLDERILAEAHRAHPDHVFLPVDELGADERFDTVAALAVIEHVPDPEASLACWSRHLLSGGRVVMTTPYGRWEGMHGVAANLRLASAEAHDEHEVTFDRAALGRLFDAVGLKMTVYRRFLLGLNQLVVGVR